MKSKEVEVVYVEDLKIDYKIVASSFWVDRDGKYHRAKKKEEFKKIIEEERGHE